MNSIATKPGTSSRIAIVLPFRTLSQFCIELARPVSAPVFVALLLIAPAAHPEDSAGEENLHSGAGLINRAPFVSSKIKPSNLDRISSDINEITDSLTNILTDPVEEEMTIIEAEKIEGPAQQTKPLIAKPVSSPPKQNELARPTVIKTEPQTNDKKQLNTQLPVQIEPVIKHPEVVADKDVEKPGSHTQVKYLKRDAEGKVVSDDATIWACVEDTENGLIWEVKSNDGGIRDKNNSFSWLQLEHNAVQSGQLQGTPDGGQCSGETSCDTLAYVQALNTQKFCGHSDWRLPTREEMLSIISFENPGSSVSINSRYFPETLPSWYWTASSNKNHPKHAWYVLFRNGVALNDLKERPKHIRLVRNQLHKG